MSFKDLILKKEERKFGDDKSLNIGLGDIYEKKKDWNNPGNIDLIQNWS